MKEELKLEHRMFPMNKKALLFIIVLFIGLGLAYITSNLTIRGDVNVSGNSWLIYFTNVQVNEGSVEASVVPTTVGKTTTFLDYTVHLEEPGDFYEFTVDVINEGTLDAVIKSITTPDIDSRTLQYIRYSATYEDGTELAKNDILEKDSSVTYKIRVEYKENIDSIDLSENPITLTLLFGVDYVQYTIPSEPVESDFINLIKDRALLDDGIDFKKSSSNTNGKGIFIRNGTEDDIYPIYYYRGAITDNNVKFAGFCWKVVRTTETGGTKLIYNGIPDTNGGCTATGTSAQLETTNCFNEDSTDPYSPSYAGYMYGKVYEMGYKTALQSYSYVYGNSFIYENGTYILQDTIYTKLTSNVSNEIDSYHYTCFNATGECEEVKYIYSINSTGYYIILKNGESIQDALKNMFSESSNTMNSNMKTTIDNWFQENLVTYFTNVEKNYNDYLEDSIWCNDRGISNYVGFNPDGGSNGGIMYFNAYRRIFEQGTPSFLCESKNDSFTVNDIKNGNGALTYPVGLLTADEVVFSGDVSTYLYTGKDWWTMTPYGVYSSTPHGYYYHNGLNGDSYGSVRYSYGVRPSISIKPNVKIATGGDGSTANPYEFVLE